jgi:hypothetical protein
MILAASMIAVCEGFVMGEKLGLSHQALFDVASASSAQCWALTSYCPVPGPVPVSPANNSYKPGFAAALMLKDLKLAKAAADSAGVKNAIGAHAAEIYSPTRGTVPWIFPPLSIWSASTRRRTSFDADGRVLPCLRSYLAPALSRSRSPFFHRKLRDVPIRCHKCCGKSRCRARNDSCSRNCWYSG